MVLMFRTLLFMSGLLLNWHFSLDTLKLWVFFPLDYALGYSVCTSSVCYGFVAMGLTQ